MADLHPLAHFMIVAPVGLSMTRCSRVIERNNGDLIAAASQRSIPVPSSGGNGSCLPKAMPLVNVLATADV